MDLKKRMISLLLSLVLCGAVFVPPASSASSTVYFTSINDNLRPLTADTMPTWSGGVLYVPYTVFLAQYNGGFKLVDVDYSYIHTSTTHKLTLYTLQQMLTFDLKNGTCREEISGESYPAQAHHAKWHTLPACGHGMQLLRSGFLLYRLQPGLPGPHQQRLGGPVRRQADRRGQQPDKPLPP